MQDKLAEMYYKEPLHQASDLAIFGHSANKAKNSSCKESNNLSQTHTI